MFSTSPLDWLLVGAYFAFLVAVALGFRRAGSSAVEYLLAGRRVTLPAFVATLVTTWYGGILGVGEYSWRYGVSNWLVFGVPYYIGALLFALLFARRARTAELYTVPDVVARRYGRGPALMAAFTVFICSAPAAYVLMLGTLFAAMFPMSLTAGVIAASLLSLFYIHRGGMRSVVFSDQVQFVLMYAGFAMMLGVLVTRHGGLGFLRTHLPATHFAWNGGNPAASIIVWYFIALVTLVDPGFWQRAYAARDPRVARAGVLWSIACWIVFDFMTTACGMYARALLPHLAQPVFAFPELAKRVLPAGALGLFYLAMIATVMSTIDSYGFIAATTIGRDVVWRLRGESDESRMPAYTRWGLWVTAAFGTALALVSHSIIDLWHDLGSLGAPTLLLPVASALSGRGLVSGRWMLAAMIVPFILTLSWMLPKDLGPPGSTPPFGIEPIYVGLTASLAMWILGRLARGASP
ncbi:MAG: sodium:solute symporter, partial [Candidatus Eisenbacteria bacterium]